jgi:putative endonuclease
LISSLFDWLRHRIRRRRATVERSTGARGEDLAMRYLQKQNFTIVERNYRPRTGSGEIDLIAWEEDTLAFIEVKTRATDDTGMPDRAVDKDKVRHIQRAARDYVRRTDTPWERVRFDIVTVLDIDNPRIELFRGAFG